MVEKVLEVEQKGERGSKGEWEGGGGGKGKRKADKWLVASRQRQDQWTRRQVPVGTRDQSDIGKEGEKGRMGKRCRSELNNSGGTQRKE